MINQLMGGISRLLYERFGEGTVIYQDAVPQGFQEPCFFLLLTELLSVLCRIVVGRKRIPWTLFIFQRSRPNTRICLPWQKIDAFVRVRHTDGGG